jgi:hypothetical protein
MSDQPWDPVTGAATALIGNLSNFMVGTASLPADLVKAIKKTKRTNTNTDIESIASRQSTSSELSRSQLKVSQEQSFNYVHNASHVLSNDWVHLLKIPRETIRKCYCSRSIPRMTADCASVPVQWVWPKVSTTRRSYIMTAL